MLPALNSRALGRNQEKSWIWEWNPRVLSCSPSTGACAAAPCGIVNEEVEEEKAAQLDLFQAGSSGKSSGSRAWTRQMGQVLECCLSHVRMHCGHRERVTGTGWARGIQLEAGNHWHWWGNSSASSTPLKSGGGEWVSCSNGIYSAE